MEGPSSQLLRVIGAGLYFGIISANETKPVFGFVTGCDQLMRVTGKKGRLVGWKLLG